MKTRQAPETAIQLGQTPLVVLVDLKKKKKKINTSHITTVSILELLLKGILRAIWERNPNK